MRRTSKSSESIQEVATRHNLRVRKQADRTKWPQFRLRVAGLIESKYFDAIMGLIIVFNVILMVIDADARADCVVHDSGICGPPETVLNLHHVLLGLYAVEAASRFYVYRSRFLLSAWNILDLFIVVTGLVDMVLIDSIMVPNLQVLRVFRILRLLRVVRLLALFPELQTMFHGMACAMKAMFWGVMMILIMLGVWSLLTVEFLSVRGTPEGLPEHCDEGFSSVLKSTHFFFQLIIAGEGWSECVRPLVHAHPETFLLFATAVVTMHLGFMNLILTVIVQEVSNAQDQDYEQRLKDKKMHEQQCLDRWKDIIRQIDRDGNGIVTKEELRKSFNTQKDVEHFFELLDIDDGNLDRFFDVIDSDHSCEVSYEEFFDALRMAQSQDVRSALFNLRLQVSQISESVQRRVKESIEESLQDLEKAVRDQQVEQKLISEQRGNILGGAGKQLEDIDVALSSLHMQLDHRLEQMSQCISENMAMLSRNTDWLEAALSQLGELQVQGPAHGFAKKTLCSEAPRSRAPSSAPPRVCPPTAEWSL